MGVVTLDRVSHDPSHICTACSRKLHHFCSIWKKKMQRVGFLQLRTGTLICRRICKNKLWKNYSTNKPDFSYALLSLVCLTKSTCKQHIKQSFGGIVRYIMARLQHLKSTDSLHLFCEGYSAGASRTPMTPPPPQPPPTPTPPSPPAPPPPRNIPLRSRNVPLGASNRISLVPRTAIGMHWSYSPLRKGTLLRSASR